ncbi:MAG: alanine racemase [Victivallaceae bacterium]|nr:alanine racemase [Victivallaceae bacterium]
MIRRSWVEIDLQAIARNYAVYKSQLAPQLKVMAVVKADAYGHGDVEVANVLQTQGCGDFAVSNIEEAIKLREAGIKGQILILGYTPIDCVELLKQYDITQALLSEDYAQRLAGQNIKAQFAIDTGMNRIGLDSDDPKECERIIRQYQTQFKLTGLFTHLCVADTPAEEAFTSGQIENFKAVAESVQDLHLPFIHCMNSAGGLWQKPYGNLARLGIVLYGLKPDYDNQLPDGISPALQWKSVISLVKTLRIGETVGYGRTFTAKREMRIATIPTGYADGYNRLLSNRGFVLIHGKKAPLVGRVCMDQITVDVTEIPEAQFEDEVTLLGDGFNADDMGKMISTIGYEIICGISKRVSRVYKK